MTKLFLTLALLAFGSVSLASSLVCDTVAYSDPNGRLTGSLEGSLFHRVDLWACHEDIDDCVRIGAAELSSSPSASSQNVDYVLGIDNDGYKFTMTLPALAVKTVGHFKAELTSEAGTKKSTVQMDCTLK